MRQTISIGYRRLGRPTWALSCFAIAILLIAPVAHAHTAPAERDFEKRLLHDCNDDYFGGDTGIGDRPGYDLHALDVREAYSSALGQHLIFRIILNGEGQSTFKLSLDADGSSKSYQFQGQGSSWSGTFDDVRYVASIGDGERFALEGAVKRSTLGIGVGDKISNYVVEGSQGGDAHDTMPGNDATIGACSDNFRRPDYTLTGPTQYVDATLDASDITVRVGEEALVSLEVSNKLRDMAQTASLALAGSGADLRFHDPGTGDYTQDVELDLNKRGAIGDTGFIHVAVGGETPGSGTATIEILTSQGGRVVKSFDFTVLADDAPQPQPTPQPGETPDDAPGDEIPAAPIALLLIGLLAMARRR